MRLTALKVLKDLGRLPGGSAPIASKEGLRTLLAQLTLPSSPPRRSQEPDQDRNSLQVPSSSSSRSLSPSSFRSVSRRPSAETISGRSASDPIESSTAKLSSSQGRNGWSSPLYPSSSSSPSTSGKSSLLRRRLSTTRGKKGSNSSSEDSGGSSPSGSTADAIKGLWISHKQSRGALDAGDVGASGKKADTSAQAEWEAFIQPARTAAYVGSLDWKVNDMALRCLNNTLLLNEQCRSLFSSEEVGGGRIAIALLQCASSAPSDIVFLSARLIFFSTLFEVNFNKTAVEELGIVPVLTECLSMLLRQLQSLQAKTSLPLAETSSFASASTASVPADDKLRELQAACAEVLKACFNLSLYYPRFADEELRRKDPKAIIGEGFHPALASLLDPIVRLVLLDPPSTPPCFGPPLTNAVSVLLNFPVREYKQVWFQRSEARNAMSTASSPSLASAKRFAQSIFSSISNSNNGGGKGQQADAKKDLPPLLQTLLDIVDRTLARYFSSMDPDDAGIKSQAERDGVSVEDLLEPLLLLVRKLVVEDADARQKVLATWISADVDRSIGLDRRSDVTGRLVRLMASGIFPRLRRAAGELLLGLHHGSPQEMTSNIGYGPCIGFLTSVNLAGGIQPAPSTTDHKRSASGKLINPVTGTYEPSEAELANDPINQMTEAEKEAEAERLFGLFDKLNKTGVIKTENPLQRPEAQQRFQELTEEEDRRKEEEEDEEEAAALREFQLYKQRKRAP